MLTFLRPVLSHHHFKSLMEKRKKISYQTGATTEKSMLTHSWCTENPLTPTGYQSEFEIQ